MGHYDGPAFFRKYFGGQRPPKLKETSQHSNNSKLNKDLDIKQPPFKLKYDYTDDTNNDGMSLAQKTRAFKPKNFQDNNSHFFYPNRHKDTKFDRAASELDREFNNPILLEGVPQKVSDKILSHEGSTSNHSNGLKNTHDTSSIENSVNYENRNESAVDNSKITSNKSSRDKGLGHSLSDIFNDENGLADNLPLFKKRPDTHFLNKNEENEKDISFKKDSYQDNLQNNNLNNDNIQSDYEKSPSKTNNLLGYSFPYDSLLKPAVNEINSGEMETWIKSQAQKLDDTLKAFNVHGHVVGWTDGPTVTQFQIKLDLGVKVSKITNLNDDLKMALAAKDIRIEAPIPGKSTVGIEIPNPSPRPVMLSEIIDSNVFKDENLATDVALGVNIQGKVITSDLRKMPHALIAGATGSGKSVFINSLLVSLLYHATPRDLKMILIDPKAVELAPYNGIPHLLTPVVSNPKEAAAALKWVVTEMDNRYERLAATGVRNIEQYNQKAKQTGHEADKLPYILVVIDELADLMMVASNEVQDYIVRITQKARAAGIHLIVATQRPSVDVVTGTIKNNIPTRIAFMVSSQVDSRTIIDQAGADRLLGKGDMLYLGSGANKPERLQGAFVSNKEVEAVTDFVRKQEQPHYEFESKSLLKSADKVASHDELWGRVLKYISNEENISTSKLQRVFSIGYNRAASIIDDLEQNNFISGQQGSKPRDVYLTQADFKKLNF